MTLQFEPSTNTLTCLFSQRMDTESSIEAQRILHQKLAEMTGQIDNREGDVIPLDTLKVIFDLEKVEYIASAFLRICLAIAKNLTPGNFSIINTSPEVKKTFKIAGLDQVLHVL